MSALEEVQALPCVCGSQGGHQGEGSCEGCAMKPRSCGFPECPVPKRWIGSTYCEGHKKQVREGKALTPLIRCKVKGRWRTGAELCEPRVEIQAGERCPRCALLLPHASCLPPLNWFAQRRDGVSSGLDVGPDRDGE